MGTASTTKFIKNNAGALTEQAALTTSAGAGDAQALVALNASGILDSTIVNSKNTSAGAGDAGKLPALNASGILDDSIINASATASANKIAKLNGTGILDDTLLNASVTSAANKIVKLDGSGRLDATVMPVGVGADTAAIVASEILAAGDLVNVWNNTGTANVRKADASTSGKEAHGFVLAGFSASASATVYFEGTNTQCTGLTPGAQFLSGTAAGKSSTTAASGTGKIVQRVGFALSATSLNFQAESPIVLA